MSITRSIYRFSVVSGVVFALAMLVIVIYQIVSRYLPIWSAPWSEEMARFLWIWVIALICGPAYVHGGYVGIDLIPNLLRPGLLRRLRQGLHFIVACYAAALAYYGWQLAAKTVNQSSPALGLNMSLINGAMSLAGISLFLGAVYCLFRQPNPPTELTADPFRTETLAEPDAREHL